MFGLRLADPEMLVVGPNKVGILCDDLPAFRKNGRKQRKGKERRTARGRDAGGNGNPRRKGEGEDEGERKTQGRDRRRSDGRRETRSGGENEKGTVAAVHGLSVRE